MYMYNFFTQGTNTCGVSFLGDCSHVCLLSTSRQGYTCACPDGMVLQRDRTCIAGIIYAYTTQCVLMQYYSISGNNATS